MDILLHTHTLACRGLGIVGGIIGLLTTVFWLWMLIDAILSPRRGAEKIVWVLVVLFLHFLGALVYYFIGRGGARSGPVV